MAATGSATIARCSPAWRRAWRRTAGRPRSPGYTLTPDASLTQIVAELRQALDWLDAHRRQRGIAGPLMLSGWSAGGHLAALLLDHPSIAAGCAISGVYELGPIRDTYLNEKVRLTDEEIATLSPLRLPQSAKPLTITYGTRELRCAGGLEPRLARQARRGAPARRPRAGHRPRPLLHHGNPALADGAADQVHAAVGRGSVGGGSSPSRGPFWRSACGEGCAFDTTCCGSRRRQDNATDVLRRGGGPDRQH